MTRTPSTRSISAALVLALTLVAAPTLAEEPVPPVEELPRQAVNICAIAIPAMNAWVLNHEILLGGRHGLASRVEFVPMSGGGAKGTELAAVLNYRWHVSEALEGFFVGAYARYRHIFGSGTAGDTRFTFDVPEVNTGLNGGYRWISSIGVNVVLAAGYGYSWTRDEVRTAGEGDTAAAARSLAGLKAAHAAFADAPYNAEVSIGYAW